MLRSEARLVIAATGIDPLGGIEAEAGAVDAAIAARPTLGADQARAVRHLCSGDARVRVLEARAGSGKTFALEADGTVAWRVAHSDVVTAAELVGGRLVLTGFDGQLNALDPSTGRAAG